MPNDANRKLEDTAWSHIRSERYTEAEISVEQLIAEADSGDASRLWYLFGLLASILNSLHRSQDATLALRRALTEARRIGTTRPEIGVSRYMLANQHLIHGDPAEALAEAIPVPEGTGHTECLLHSVVAQALWKLERHAEAQQAARSAVAASPTDERRSELTDELAQILRATNA
jgi:hypothetical protein